MKSIEVREPEKFGAPEIEGRKGPGEASFPGPFSWPCVKTLCAAVQRRYISKYILSS